MQKNKIEQYLNSIKYIYENASNKAENIWNKFEAQEEKYFKKINNILKKFNFSLNVKKDEDLEYWRNEWIIRSKTLETNIFVDQCEYPSFESIIEEIENYLSNEEYKQLENTSAKTINKFLKEANRFLVYVGAKNEKDN